LDRDARELRWTTSTGPQIPTKPATIVDPASTLRLDMSNTTIPMPATIMITSVSCRMAGRAIALAVAEPGIEQQRDQRVEERQAEADLFEPPAVVAQPGDVRAPLRRKVQRQRADGGDDRKQQPPPNEAIADDGDELARSDEERQRVQQMSGRMGTSADDALPEGRDLRRRDGHDDHRLVGAALGIAIRIDGGSRTGGRRRAGLAEIRQAAQKLVEPRFLRLGFRRGVRGLGHMRQLGHADGSIRDRAAIARLHDRAAFQPFILDQGGDFLEPFLRLRVRREQAAAIVQALVAIVEALKKRAQSIGRVVEAVGQTDAGRVRLLSSVAVNAFSSVIE
jgi:hypothetical protein